MSEEKNNPDNNQDDRKAQFEKMRERFSKKNNNAPKNSFNFYWIYALVVIALLVLTYYDGAGFGRRTISVSQTEFEQNMLAKGDVGATVIVNEKVAEIYIRKDSLK